MWVYPLILLLMPGKIMGREEPPRRASMAQRVLTKELLLRVDVLLALCRGCGSISSLRGCCAHSQLLDYCVAFAPSRLLLSGTALLCSCLTFAQWIIHVHVYGMWGVLMRKGYAVSFLFWFLKIKTFLSRDFMETQPDTWTWKQMQ